LLLASIINEKVHIIRLDVDAAIATTERKDFADDIFIPTQVILPGYSVGPAITDIIIKTTNDIISTKVNLTAPGKPPLKVGNIRQDTKSIAGDKLQEEWFKYLVRPRTILSKKRRSVDQQETTRSSGKSGDAVNVDEVDDAENSANSAADSTVLFSTIMNTADNLVCMHISDEARQLVGGFRDHSVKVWYLDENDESGLPGRLLGSERERMLQPYTKLRSSGSSLNGHKKATALGNQEKLTLDLYGHTKAVYGVSQDSTSRFVLSASGDETVRLWDTAVAQCVGKYSGICPFWGVAYSPVGYYFATANQDKTASMYSTDRPQPLRLFSGHVSDVSCVDFHPNAALLVSGSDDRTCRLWDVRQGSSAQLLQGCPAAVNCVSVSKDGRLLAAGTASGSLHVWDLLTGKALGLLVGHTGPVYTAAFSDDTTVLGSGGADCSVRVWSMENITKVPLEVRSGASSNSLSLACSRYLLSPADSFSTKYTPIYYLNYNSSNMMYAGGPFMAPELEN
jgi:transcription initiation factor TFIID subunit 5